MRGAKTTVGHRLRVCASLALLVAGCSSADDAGDAGADAVGPSTEDRRAACTVSDDTARCDSMQVVTIDLGGDPRRAYWALPTTAAPEGGYPAVILYQGSLYGPSMSWDVELASDTPFGGYYQLVLIDSLLEAGFVVVQPEASGGLVWNTNGLASYDSTGDAVFIPELLAQIGDGVFGPVDTGQLYATGISSGGYMTSRMAVSYPGRFVALAIMAGSYATCLGPQCNPPDSLPDDHPPTLMLHGGADTTVPIGSARKYETLLLSEGVETRFVENASAGHEWLPSAPGEITAWFEDH